MAARAYRVWCPDRGQTEDDAKLITALTSIGAACDFAQDHAGFHGDPFTSLDVKVRVAGTVLVHDITVDVELIPSFCGQLQDTEHVAEASDG